ncbi:hypothetical protein ACFU99_05875 [Streptomyces sp. NPDC057654]|uniref:hypothetical protein n=1 Tax=Streptomyces sp. NPDC057654 TaxID=3346196 RepID=UPI0036AA6068
MSESELLRCAREGTCSGHYEVRIPVFFDLRCDMSMTFQALGEAGGMGGVVTDCSECGMPAPRTFLCDLAEAVHALENKLKELLA